MRVHAGMLLVIAAGTLHAQQSATVAGDYAGTQGGTRIVLHLTAGADGALKASTDTPDQGVFGLQCADVSLRGQNLSFSVPSVHGTWTGFVTDNGATLAGMWNQGSPKPLNFTRLASAAAPARPAAAAPTEVPWDTYTFKFVQNDMMQAMQHGILVGTIVTANGQEKVIPVPGHDPQALQKSFDDYRVFAARSQGATPPPTGEVTIAAVRFDDAAKSIVVPQPDGTEVTFVGDDVKISGRFPGTGYLLRPQKASVRRTLERSLFHPNTTDAAAFGNGVEFLREAGGLIYDSGMGGYDAQEDPRVLKAKQLSKIAVDAVDAVRHVPGHADFTPTAYQALLKISQYKLRSDGSR